MAQHPFNEFYSTNKDGIKGLNTLSPDTKKEIIQFEFIGGDYEKHVPFPVVNTTDEYRTNYIDVSKYKKIEIIVRNRVHGSPGVQVGFAMGVSGGSGVTGHARYFDWNSEEWLSNSYFDLEDNEEVVLPQRRNDVYLLSTHPQFYWLKDFAGDKIQFRFKAKNTPPVIEGSPNHFAAYLVGEVNV